jgi:hypothetical protein
MNLLNTRWGQLLKVCMVFIDSEATRLNLPPRKAVSLSGFAFVSNGKEAELLYIIE